MKISDDSVLFEIGEGWPWETVDDTLCKPEGAFRRHIEDMVSRGVLVDDGKFVRPANKEVAAEARAKVMQMISRRKISE